MVLKHRDGDAMLVGSQEESGSEGNWLQVLSLGHRGDTGPGLHKQAPIYSTRER